MALEAEQKGITRTSQCLHNNPEVHKITMPSKRIAVTLPKEVHDHQLPTFSVEGKTREQHC